MTPPDMTADEIASVDDVKSLARQVNAVLDVFGAGNAPAPEEDPLLPTDTLLKQSEAALLQASERLALVPPTDPAAQDARFTTLRKHVEALQASVASATRRGPPVS